MGTKSLMNVFTGFAHNWKINREGAFIPTAQVLLERAGREVPKAQSDQQEAIWAAMRKEHAASMSR